MFRNGGFSKPALLKAALYGIEAVTIEEALASDWEFAAELTATGFVDLTTFKYGCAIVYDSPDEGGLQQKEITLQSKITVESAGAVTIDQLVRNALDRTEISTPLFEQLRKSGERQFWLTYTHNSELTTQVDGARVRVKELRIGIHVDYTETPVQYAKGRVRGTPFISGSSDDPATKKLQLVLIKNQEGKVEGRIMDETGIRTLSSTSHSS